MHLLNCIPLGSQLFGGQNLCSKNVVFWGDNVCVWRRGLETKVFHKQVHTLHVTSHITGVPPNTQYATFHMCLHHISHLTKLVPTAAKRMRGISKPEHGASSENKVKLNIEIEWKLLNLQVSPGIMSGIGSAVPAYPMNLPAKDRKHFESKSLQHVCFARALGIKLHVVVNSCQLKNEILYFMVQNNTNKKMKYERNFKYIFERL